MEARLRQAQRLEAIGSLAGGVAHDFNNLLSVILSYSQMLAEGLAPDDPMRGDLEEIAGAGERAADPTRQLLAFSRQQLLMPRSSTSTRPVSALSKLLRRLLGEDVELALVAGPGLGRGLADPGQVEQVVMNLVVNARDAMPEGGKVTVETASVELDARDAKAHERIAPGRYVRVATGEEP